MQNISQPKINLIKDGSQIKCESCGGETFREAFFLFKVSKILTGEAQDSMVPVPTFACASCGHINKEFSLPKESAEEVM
jgi:uncharacterized Zn finger protein